jgi:hypothetical protein
MVGCVCCGSAIVACALALGVDDVAYDASDGSAAPFVDVGEPRDGETRDGAKDVDGVVDADGGADGADGATPLDADAAADQGAACIGAFEPCDGAVACCGPLECMVGSCAKCGVTGDGCGGPAPPFCCNGYFCNVSAGYTCQKCGLKGDSCSASACCTGHACDGGTCT